jgi:hypothetical protein
VDGFAIPRLVSYLGALVVSRRMVSAPVVRLVRAHPHALGRHRSPRPREVQGRLLRLRAPIFHYTYDDVTDHLRTVARLTAVAARQVPAGRRVGVGDWSSSPAGASSGRTVVKQGFREGLPGFFVAATDAFYVFLRWARVWDRERRPC